MKKMIGFKIDFLLILAGFWEGFGRVWETKLDQKSIKNRYGKMMKFLEVSWRHLGGILEASWKLLEASGAKIKKSISFGTQNENIFLRSGDV